MENNDKIQGVQIKSTNPAMRKIENFWYHYKWMTIVVLFFVIVFVVCSVQMCGNEKEDISVVYAGPVKMTSEELANFESVMEFVMPDDFDKNGKKDVKGVGYRIYSEEQIKEIEAQTNSAGDREEVVNRQANSDNYDVFYNYIQTGDSSICFLDKSIYDNLRKNDRLAKISDALGYEDENSFDGYGYRLGDLEIYKSYKALEIIPEDTVICILRPLVAGKSSDEELYAFEKEMFASIVDFGSAE